MITGFYHRSLWGMLYNIQYISLTQVFKIQEIMYSKTNPIARSGVKKLWSKTSILKK